MSNYLGDFNGTETLPIPFTTHAAAGGSIAPLSAFEVADIRIYKGVSDTERGSTAGYAIVSPFDGVTGLHMFSVDLSDNTTAGFFAAGNDYSVVLVPDTETVDGQTVVKVLAKFSIKNRSAIRPATAGRDIVVSAGGVADAQVKGIDANQVTAAAVADGAIDAAAIAADAITSAKIADGALTAAKIAADAITAAKIAAGAITAAKFAAGAIDAAAIATDAIDADALKADAITEIQAGLALDATVAKAAVTALEATAQLIKTKTDALPPDPADASVIALATNAILDAIAALQDLSPVDVQDAMTAQGYTGARAAFLDRLDVLVSSRAATGEYTASVAALTAIVQFLKNVQQGSKDYVTEGGVKKFRVRKASDDSLLLKHTATQVNGVSAPEFGASPATAGPDEVGA